MKFRHFIFGAVFSIAMAPMLSAQHMSREDAVSAFKKSRTRKTEDRIPFVRTGYAWGTNGTVPGHAAIIEINPKSWFGFYGIAGHSSLSNHVEPGILPFNVRVRALHGGGGGTLRFPLVAKEHFGLRLGAFFQAQSVSSGIKAYAQGVMPDDEGNPMPFVENYKEYWTRTMVTLGPNIEFRIWRLPTILVRPGVNVLNPLQHETPIYFAIGMVGNPGEFGHNLKRVASRLSPF